MAVIKEIENEFGAKFNYHKLQKVIIENTDNGVTIIMNVESYLNEDARKDGKVPTVRQCIINGADFALTPFYQILKGKFPEFQNCEDEMSNAFMQEEKKLKPKMTFLVQDQHYRNVQKWEEKENKEND